MSLPTNNNLPRGRRCVIVEPNALHIVDPRLLSDPVFRRCIDRTLHSIKQAHKLHTSTDDALTKMVMEYVCTNLGINEMSGLDAKELDSVSKAIYDYMWKVVNYEEAERVKRLITEEKNQEFTFKFFHSTDTVASVITPLCKGLIQYYHDTYGIDMAINDIESCVHRFMWGSGDWRPLTSFDGRCSIFAWIKKISIQRINDMLEQEGTLPKRQKSTAAKDFCIMDSWPVEARSYIIDTVCTSARHRSLLRMKFVDGKSDEAIAQELKIKGDVVEAIRKSVRYLMEQYADYPDDLGMEFDDVSKSAVAVRLDDNYGASTSIEDEDTDHVMACLRRTYGEHLTVAELGEHLNELLKTAAMATAIRPLEKSVFELRYWEHKTSVEVADLLDVDVDEVYKTYSRVNKKIVKEAKKILGV